MAKRSSGGSGGNGGRGGGTGAVVPVSAAVYFGYDSWKGNRAVKTAVIGEDATLLHGVTLGGRRVPVSRPRVRSADGERGKEVLGSSRHGPKIPAAAAGHSDRPHLRDCGGV